MFSTWVFWMIYLMLRKVYLVRKSDIIILDDIK